MSASSLTLAQMRYVNKAFWRNPASAFFTFAFPLMFLVIFTSLLGNGTVPIGGREINQSTYYVAAMAAFAVITACYNNIAIALTFQRDAGVLKRTNGTPLPSRLPRRAGAARAADRRCSWWRSPSHSAGLFYGADVPDRSHAGPVPGHAGVGAATLLRARLRHHGGHPERRRRRADRQRASILPLLFLSGIFIPFGDDTPAWITWVARIFPVKHFADGMQAGIPRHAIPLDRRRSSSPPGAWPGCCSPSATSAGSRTGSLGQM